VGGSGRHGKIESYARRKGKSVLPGLEIEGMVVRPMMACFLHSARVTETDIRMSIGTHHSQDQGAADSGHCPDQPSKAPDHPSTRRAAYWLASSTAGLLLLLASACQSTNPRVVASTDGPYDLTTILPGDVIRLSFPGATNYNTELKIPIDGEVVLPAAFGKPINATGMTRADLEKALHDQLKTDVRIPDVNVTLVTSAAVVYVSGAVITPNKIPMTRPLTLLDALMEAGGPDMHRAKLADVAVVRNFNGEQRSFVVDMRSAFSGGNVMPFYLRPFDSVVVPARKFNF
jgi:protein involved in polysaccharide export with SLBB domain